MTELREACPPFRGPAFVIIYVWCLLALAPLAADEVQESVKFSSREKLAVCKVIEGAVKLSPGRGQRVAPLEVVG